MARLSADGKSHVLAIMQETASRNLESLPFDKPALRRVIEQVDAWAEVTPAEQHTPEAFLLTLSAEGLRLLPEQRERLFTEVRTTRQAEGI